MGKRKLLLLKFLIESCESGYKVIEVSKIFGNIKRYKNNFSQLREDIEYLKQHRYIDLKYLDEENICLAVLDNTYVFQENLSLEKSSKNIYSLFLIMTMLFSGFMAFIGAFIAIIIIR